MNVYQTSLSIVVRDVFRKIVSQDLRLAVWIDAYGEVKVKQNRPDKRMPPQEWLVGEYTWRVPLTDLTADIEARVGELRPICRRVAAYRREPRYLGHTT